MRINFKATNIDHTPAIDTLFDEKLVAPVRRLLGDIDAKVDLLFDVEFERTTHHHRHGKIWRAEAQLNLPRRSSELRAEAMGESLEEAVNIVKSELLREIARYKEERRA